RRAAGRWPAADTGELGSGKRMRAAIRTACVSRIRARRCASRSDARRRPLPRLSHGMPRAESFAAFAIFAVDRSGFAAFAVFAVDRSGFATFAVFAVDRSGF